MDNFQKYKPEFNSEVALLPKSVEPFSSIAICSGTLNLATYSEVISSPHNVDR